MLPTPSTSSSTPEAIQQLRQEVEQQIAEKEQQLQDSTSGIGKSVLSRQIARLKERLEEMDQQEQQQQQPAEQVSSSAAAAPLHHSSITNTKNERGDVGGSEGEVNDYQEGLSPSTLEKLQKLERDIRSYQQQQQQQQQLHSLGPSSSSNHHHHHRKDKVRKGIRDERDFSFLSFSFNILFSRCLDSLYLGQQHRQVLIHFPVHRRPICFHLHHSKEMIRLLFYLFHPHHQDLLLQKDDPKCPTQNAATTILNSLLRLVMDC